MNSGHLPTDRYVLCSIIWMLLAMTPEDFAELQESLRVAGGSDSEAGSALAPFALRKAT